MTPINLSIDRWEHGFCCQLSTTLSKNAKLKIWHSTTLLWVSFNSNIFKKKPIKPLSTRPYYWKKKKANISQCENGSQNYIDTRIFIPNKILLDQNHKSIRKLKKKQKGQNIRKKYEHWGQ